MKIEKSLKIAITQADVETAIKALIQKEDPAIIVDEIVFAATRKGGDSISVKVDAHFGESQPEEVVVLDEIAGGEIEEEDKPQAIEVAEESEEAPFEGDAVLESPSKKASLFS